MKQSKQLDQKTKICKVCFNQIEDTTFHSVLNKLGDICHDCFLKLGPCLNEFKVDGIKCLNIYFYKEKFQELLYQFKGCKDYELKSVFLEYYLSYVNQRFKNFVIVPAPSYSKSDDERGFNHVISMFEKLNMQVVKCVHKIKKVKQADLDKNERAKIGDALIIDDIDFRGAKVLIVDDVFTTGSTVKAMINLIRTKHPKKIEVLVMSKTLDLDQRKSL